MVGMDKETLHRTGKREGCVCVCGGGGDTKVFYQKVTSGFKLKEGQWKLAR